MVMRWAFVVTLWATLGCKGEPRRIAPAAPSASAPVVLSAAPLVPDAGALLVVSQGFDSVVARAFVARWLAAQNEHDFASYSALYAQREALRAQALSAFKALPAYRELQARFARDAPNPDTPWETVDGASSVVEVRSSPESALLVVAARGGAGCGGFGGNLSAIWKVSGSAAKLTLRGVFEDGPDLLQIGGALDQNADGALELLAGPDVFADEISVLRLGPSSYRRSVLFATSFWDCAC